LFPFHYFFFLGVSPRFGAGGVAFPHGAETNSVRPVRSWLFGFFRHLVFWTPFDLLSGGAMIFCNNSLNVRFLCPASPLLHWYKLFRCFFFFVSAALSFRGVLALTYVKKFHLFLDWVRCYGCFWRAWFVCHPFAKLELLGLTFFLLRWVFQVWVFPVCVKGRVSFGLFTWCCFSLQRRRISVANCSVIFGMDPAIRFQNFFYLARLLPSVFFRPG